MKGNSFLIAAGGSGSRMGGIPKQFRELLGIPLWKWSLRLCKELYIQDCVCECIVVLPPDIKEDPGVTAMAGYSFPIHFVKGGLTRKESVLNGLRACSGEIVLIHDAARPFLDIRICSQLLKSTRHGEGAIPFLKISDALKGWAEGEPLIPVDRNGFLLTQTPQSFLREEILPLLECSDNEIRDEAEVWLKGGKTLNLIKGDPMNFKITFEKDWNMAELIASSFYEIQTGYGFDIHPLVPGRKLILAGVEIRDFPLGLYGHSDSDVVCHAVSDAILGAAGLPDIGILFPADDNSYKNANSMDMLSEILGRIRAEGWEIQWVDTVIYAQKPVLAGYLKYMVSNLGTLLKEGDSNFLPFNIKVKSGEKIGSVGNLECIKCHAVATLKRYKHY